jgi:hypothetical protein
MSRAVVLGTAPSEDTLDRDWWTRLAHRPSETKREEQRIEAGYCAPLHCTSDLLR